MSKQESPLAARPSPSSPMLCADIRSYSEEDSAKARLSLESALLPTMVQQDQRDILHLLLDKKRAGAKPSSALHGAQSDRRRSIVFKMCCREDSVAMIKMLRQAEDPGLPSSSVETTWKYAATSESIQQAVCSGSCNVVKLLLWEGQSPPPTATEKRAKKQFESESSRVSPPPSTMPKVVLPRIDLNSQEVCGSDWAIPLTHVAITQHNAPMLRLLLQGGASLGIAQYKSISPLTAAAATNSVECLQVMVDEVGPDEAPLVLLNSRQSATENAGPKKSESQTALSVACSRSHIKFVDTLLSLGADINIQDEDGKTVFHRAVLVSNAQLLDHLLQQAGVDTEVCTPPPFDPLGTPLFEAARLGSLQCLELLLKAGANPNFCKPDLFRFPPSTGDSDEIRAGTVLEAAILGSHLQCLQSLIKGKAEVSATNPHTGKTPLQFAMGLALRARGRDKDRVQKFVTVLLESDAQPVGKRVGVFARNRDIRKK